MSRVLSIEIGMDKTKVCEASINRRQPKIYKSFAFNTPNNAVEDGYIRDKAALEAVLKKELKKAGIRTKDVVYTVTSTKIVTREVEIPPVKKDKIQQVVQANAQEYFPVDIGEYTISYSVLEKLTEGEEKGWKLLALAVPDNLVKNYYSFSESLGFKVKNIDYMGNSALQILKLQETGTINLSVMLNEETTMIYIIDHGVLSLLRTIPYGSISIIEEVLSRKIFEAENEYQALEKLCSEELILPKIGMRWEQPATSDAAEDEAAATLAPEGAALFAARRDVTDSVDYLVGNLTRMIDFFHTRKEGKQIEQILLVGQGSKIKGLETLIENETGVTTSRIDRPEGVNFGKTGSEDGSDDYISCVGALLDPVKIRSKEELAKKNRKDTLGGAKFILGLSAIAAVVLTGSSMFALNQEKDREKALDEMIATLAPVEEIYEEKARVQKEYNEYTTAYTMTETETEKLSELFAELEYQLPTTVVVNTFAVDGEQLSMTMQAKNKLSVAKLMMNLKEIELLSDISLPAVAKGEDAMGGEVWSYSITCRFAAFEEAAEETPAPEALAPEEAEAQTEEGGSAE